MEATEPCEEWSAKWSSQGDTFRRANSSGAKWTYLRCNRSKTSQNYWHCEQMYPEKRHRQCFDRRWIFLIFPPSCRISAKRSILTSVFKTILRNFCDATRCQWWTPNDETSFEIVRALLTEYAFSGAFLGRARLCAQGGRLESCHFPC